ncbi:M23 family metallopeptidase [Candidatus Poribacteria bacterium]|nr:M23 family metallopeptidase [Candidatus Poribacteria bacterium]
MGCRKLSYYENTTAFREASPLKVVYKNPQVCRKEKPVFREVGETLEQGGGNWLSSPVGDAPISSEFMSTRNCAGCSNTHGGTDYAVPVGTPVVATAPGTVARSYRSGSYGNVVIVNHGEAAQGSGNVYTLYAHGSSLQVQQGATVNTGDLLINSGNTGRSTGPHLHYEVIVTPHTPFQSQFFGNLQIRHAPTDLGYFLGY